MDLMKITEIIKDKIEKNYSNDVAIFAYYGSYATDEATENSDIDFFYIPKTEKSNALSIQFIVDGIGIDLFPISWDRIARIVSLDQPLTSVITKSKVLYASSPEEKEKYFFLKERLEQLFSNENIDYMLSKSQDYLAEACTNLFSVQQSNGTISDLKIEASKLISNVMLAVGYLNGTYYKKGIGKAIQESFTLEKQPNDYKYLVDSLMKSTDIDKLGNDCERLISNLRILINDELKSNSQKEPYETLFIGYYEELKSVIRKVINACDNNDYYTAFFRAATIQDETAQFISKAENGVWYNARSSYSDYKNAIEDLLEVDIMDNQNDLSMLKEKVLEFDTKLRRLLTEKNVEILEFSSIEEFRAYYAGV